VQKRCEGRGIQLPPKGQGLVAISSGGSPPKIALPRLSDGTHKFVQDSPGAMLMSSA